MSEFVSNLRNRFTPASLETKRDPGPTESSDGKDRLLTASSSALTALETPSRPDASRGGHADVVFDTKQGVRRSTLDTDAHLRLLDRGNRQSVIAIPLGVPLPLLQPPVVPHVEPGKSPIPLVSRIVLYGGLLWVAGGLPGLAIGISLAAGLDRIARDVSGGDGAPAQAHVGSQVTFMVGTFALLLPPLVSDPQSRATERVLNMLAAEGVTMGTIYLCTQLRRLL